MRMLMIVAAFCVAVFASGEEKKDDTKKVALEKVWKVGEPAFKAQNEDLNPSVKIANDGSVTIANRGILVSKAEYENVTLSFSWQWVEGDDETGKYPDHFVAAFGSTGKQSETWSHELQEGLVVKFVPNAGGAIVLQDYQSGAGQELEKVKFGLKINTAYKVKVVLEGKNVSVSVNGKEVLKKKLDKEYAGRVCLYDREPVAGVKKASLVTDLVLEAPKKVKKD